MTNKEINTAKGKPKRVLMIAQSNYNYDARIIRFCDMLKNAEIGVDIICLRTDDQRKFESIENVNVYRVMRHFNQDTVLSYLLFSIIFVFRAMFKSVGLLFKNNYLIVHVHNMPDYLVFAAIFAKIKNIPVVLDIHDLVLELYQEKWANKNFKAIKKIIQFSEKLSNKFADHTITVSNECAERMIERGLQNDKITIIMNVPNRVHFPYYKSRVFSKASFNLIYHGTIAERYGLVHSIHSVALALPHIPVIKFYIVGKIDSEYGTHLKNLAINLGIQDHVIFQNSIHYNKLSEFFKEMDLGIITETTLEYSEFGIPTKAFEYVASGIPIIINDLKVSRSIFNEESVCFINYKNYNDIANKIIYLYNHPDRREKMAKSAYEDLLKVDYNIMNDRYLELIKNSLNSNFNGEFFNVQPNTNTSASHR